LVTDWMVALVALGDLGDLGDWGELDLLGMLRGARSQVNEWKGEDKSC
jgi:hypothetical protein